MKICVPLDFADTDIFAGVEGEWGWVQGSFTTLGLVDSSVPPQASVLAGSVQS